MNVNSENLKKSQNFAVNAQANTQMLKAIINLGQETACLKKSCSMSAYHNKLLKTDFTLS